MKPQLAIVAIVLGFSCASGPIIPDLRWVDSNQRSWLSFTQPPDLPYRNTPDKVSGQAVTVARPPALKAMTRPQLPSLAASGLLQPVLPSLPLAGFLDDPQSVGAARVSPVTRAPALRLAAMVPALPTVANLSKPTAPTAPTSLPKTTAPKPADGGPLLPAKSPVSVVPVEDRVKSPVVVEKTLTAKIGEEVFFQFNKLNWLLLDNGQDLHKLGFTEPKYENNATSFVFKPREAGTYQLDFQRQDNTSGTMEMQKVKLTVIPKTDPLPRIAPTESSPTTAPAKDTGGDFPEAEAQERAGNLDAALRAYLAAYSPDNSALNLKIGSLLLAKGQAADGLKYLERNLTPANPLFDRSLDRALEALVQNPDADKLSRYLTAGLQKGYRPTEGQFLAAVDALQRLGRDEDGLKLLEAYNQYYPQAKQSDAVLFLLAGILEKPIPLRDIKRAYDLYNNLLENYPLSTYWNKAGERANYLNRHYFQLR